MVILSLCGDKYNKPSDKLEDLTLLDRAWKRLIDRLSQGSDAHLTASHLATSGTRSGCGVVPALRIRQ